jgi:hypothetical protein
MNRLRLPKTVLMLTDLTVENSSGRVEENATPKFLLRAVWKISENIETTSRPKLLAVQPFHSLDKRGIFRPCSPLCDLNAKVDQTPELHVVQLDELLLECDLASHARSRQRQSSPTRAASGVRVRNNRGLRPRPVQRPSSVGRSSVRVLVCMCSLLLCRQAAHLVRHRLSHLGSSAFRASEI